MLRMWVALLLCGGGAAVASVELAVYEGFADYAVGETVLGKPGGKGFSGSWDSESSLGLPGGSGSVPNPIQARILSTSLSYSDGLRQLQTSGGSLLVSAAYGNVNLARRLDAAALPHSGPEPWIGGVSYISFLLHRGGEAADPESPIYGGSYPWGENLYPRAAALKLTGRDGRQIRIGNLSNTLDNVWRITGEDLYGTDGKRDPRSSATFGGETALVVVKILHGGGGWQADRFNVWFNPLLGAENWNAPPMQFDWTVRDNPRHIAPDWIGLTAGDASGNRPYAELIFDEFRIGTSWEQVTPHDPSPMWGNYPAMSNGDINTGARYLGWLSPSAHPQWAYNWAMDSWIHLPDEAPQAGGSWIYVPELFGNR